MKIIPKSVVVSLNSFLTFLSTPCNSAVFIKGTLDRGVFCGTLPGRESNPVCWDGIPASYHFTTLTPVGLLLLTSLTHT